MGFQDGLMPAMDQANLGVTVVLQPETVLHRAVTLIDVVGKELRDPAEGSVTMMGVEQLLASSTACMRVFSQRVTMERVHATDAV